LAVGRLLGRHLAGPNQLNVVMALAQAFDEAVKRECYPVDLGRVGLADHGKAQGPPARWQLLDEDGLHGRLKK
jgi:hypothetical protein